jgi:diguanylate cyclase (GGDEF)-like protein/PAS domain S-box-containing protein
MTQTPHEHPAWASESIERFGLSKAVEQAADAVVITGADGRILYVNPMFTAMTGYSSLEAVGQNPSVLKSGRHSEAFYRQMWETIRSGRVWDGEMVNRCKDGRLYNEEMRIAPVLDSTGEIVSYIAIKRDVTERIRTTQALAESEELYRTAFQTSLDAITINRMSDGMYIAVNRAFFEIMGYEPEEVVGRTSLAMDVWVNPLDRRNLIETLGRDSHCRDLEAQFRAKSGRVFWGLISASVIEIGGVPCNLSVIRDVSNNKLAEEKIRNLALFDPLTGLPNRLLLAERLEQALVTGSRSLQRRALLFVDLDNFKTLNDSLGHHVGDLFLQESSRRITGCIRKGDTAARLGGDEFVVMLEGLSEVLELAVAQARMVGEKILTAIGQPYRLEDRDWRITSSIGITMFKEDNGGAAEILKQADLAMYQAKSQGRNTIRFFSPVLQAAVNARASLESELRSAIGAGQLELHYQPQGDHGRFIGSEALVRWRHPERGLLPPATFIPLAEETGLILPLGDWVLKTACEQIAAWSRNEAAASLSVAVNISARQLRQPHFVKDVLAALNRAEANPRNLQLELTESMLLDDIDDTVAKIKELRNHGVRFSLDDFGTGYSSLSYLKRLPLDQLKIDRSFVHDILTDCISAAIAQSVISLGRAINLPVIAEGVETEKQREFLLCLGCQLFQGYLFSRPLPLEEFEKVLLKSTKMRSYNSRLMADSREIIQIASGTSGVRCEA